MKFRTVMTLVTVVLAAPACAVRGGADGPGAFHATSFVPLAPQNAPEFAGSYDFDMLGSSQGTGCAEWGQTHAGGFREVLVNGRPDYYSVAVSGAALASDDPRIQQAQASAAYAAMSKLPGADVILLTRSVVRSESPTRVCAYVAGEVVRLKKGPTLAGPRPPGPGANPPPSSPAAAATSGSAATTGAAPPPPPPPPQ